MEGERSAAADIRKGVTVVMNLSPLQVEAVLRYTLVFVQMSLSESVLLSSLCPGYGKDKPEVSM